MIDDGPDPEAPSPQPLPDPFQTQAVAMASHLQATRPWVRFLAIVGFISAGLMALLSLIALFASPFMENSPLGPFMSLIYLAGAVVYVIPSVYLNRYASSIAEIPRGGGLRAMAEALDHQRRFWRVAGIITVVMLCLYAAVIGLAILVALLMMIGR